MKKTSIIIISFLAYLVVGILVVLVFPDRGAHSWSNIAVLLRDFPQNIGGLIFGLFLQLLRVLLWPVHILILILG